MVPLQANHVSQASWLDRGIWEKHTKLLLDHFQDLLLIELLRETLNGGQGLSAITLWKKDEGYYAVLASIIMVYATHVGFVYVCNSETA